MKIIIGSDKSGYALRRALEAHLVERGCEIKVIGPQNADEAVPFYEVAPEAAKAVQSGEFELGILICGTGMGMAQVANKFKGIRAGVVESVYAAKMCRAINDSNILCMGGWMIAETLGIAITDAFLDSQFIVGVEEWRKQWLINAKAQVNKIEDEIYG